MTTAIRMMVIVGLLVGCAGIVRGIPSPWCYVACLLLGAMIYPIGDKCS